MKYSYHIILPRFYLNNVGASKTFCNKIKEGMRQEFRRYVDESVYSNNRQFRMVKSSKFGSGREKQISYFWNYRGKKMVLPLVKEIPNDVGLWMMIELEHTLINGMGAEIIPEFEEAKKKAISSVEVGQEEVEEVFTKFKEAFNFDDEDFTVDKVNGGIISLKRRRTTECPTCKKTHENENPYLIVGDNGICSYDCRRHPEGIERRQHFRLSLQILHTPASIVN